MHVSQPKKPNRLSSATSPYLLQHALNPVDWFEWGAEPLAKAATENKPILVSIGYSACHWCHVMERECFENQDIAEVMNEHLICIKVDREERPDIDQLYMDAVQAMGINGGWPLNVFLTPGQKPFYGGTYFPPKNWVSLIQQLSKAFTNRRNEIDQTADDIVQHLNASDLSRFTSDPGPFNPADFQTTFGILESKFDKVYGGLDRAPKFIMPAIWLWLLRFHFQANNQQALDMVLLTLRKLAAGGIYDQIGGGFSRYSVDGRWFAPHFEKMLYDNAQLLSLYSEAYQCSGEPLFKTVVFEIADWLKREMKHSEGGYYAALDADSEGVEGKFYTWTSSELRAILGSDESFFSSYYHSTDFGNWEHGRNILNRIDAPGQSLSKDQQLLIQEAKQKLLTERNKRVRPGLDDKVITSWNAMLVCGFADAYKAFGDNAFLDEALGIMGFMEKHLVADGRCYRTYKNKRSATEGFLEDYAHLIHSYILLYECTFEETWVNKAEKMCQYVIKQFRDGYDGFFFFSGSSSERLVARKKEIFDNVMPSPNSVMARNIFRLGIILDRDDWKQEAIGMATSLRKLIIEEPNYMSNWGMLGLEIASPFHEVVFTGPDAIKELKAFSATYQPFSQLMGTAGKATLPLVKDKIETGRTLVYVCTNKTCGRPVRTAQEALEIMSTF